MNWMETWTTMSLTRCKPDSEMVTSDLITSWLGGFNSKAFRPWGAASHEPSGGASLTQFFFL